MADAAATEAREILGNAPASGPMGPGDTGARTGIEGAIRSWVIYHRAFPEIPDTPWMRIAAKGGFRPTQCRDFAAVDTLDHIDVLSPIWAEFTVMYWVWRNTPATPFVSFPHYRRHFWHLPVPEFIVQPSFHIDPEPGVLAAIASRENLLKAHAVLEHSECIVAASLGLGMSIAEQFRRVHGARNWEVFQDHLSRLGGDWARHRGWFEETTRMHPYQMFVMRWPDFDDYMSMATDLMSAMHQELEIPDEGYQRRAPAYLMERFLNLYLHVKRLRKAEATVALLEPGCK